MKALRVEENDNVAVVAEDTAGGTRVEAGDMIVTAREAIGAGHKIALEDIGKDGMIYKYGVPIGKAACDIRAGEFVHTHNVVDITEELCRAYARDYRERKGN